MTRFPFRFRASIWGSGGSKNTWIYMRDVHGGSFWNVHAKCRSAQTLQNDRGLTKLPMISDDYCRKQQFWWHLMRRIKHFQHVYMYMCVCVGLGLYFNPKNVKTKCLCSALLITVFLVEFGCYFLTELPVPVLRVSWKNQRPLATRDRMIWRLFGNGPLKLGF